MLLRLFIVMLGQVRREIGLRHGEAVHQCGSSLQFGVSQERGRGNLALWMGRQQIVAGL